MDAGKTWEKHRMYIHNKLLTWTLYPASICSYFDLHVHNLTEPLRIELSTVYTYQLKHEFAGAGLQVQVSQYMSVSYVSNHYNMSKFLSSL